MGWSRETRMRQIKQYQKPCIKTKKVIDIGKTSKKLNEVKHPLRRRVTLSQLQGSVYACKLYESLYVGQRFPRNIEILGWYPVESILPLEETVFLQAWLDTLLVMVLQQKYLIVQMICCIDKPRTPSFPNGLVKTNSNQLRLTQRDESWWQL